MSASRVQLTPLHNYNVDEGQAKPALSTDELWAQAHQELHALLSELDSAADATMHGDGIVGEIPAIEELADNFEARKKERNAGVTGALDRVDELQRRADEASEDAVPSFSKAECADRLKHLEKQKSNIIGSIINNQQLSDDLQKKMAHLTQESEVVKRKVVDLKEEDDVELAFRAYLLNVMTKVTGTVIKPVRNADQNFHGAVSGPRKKTLINVTNENIGKFDCVNHLWDLATGDSEQFDTKQYGPKT